VSALETIVNKGQKVVETDVIHLTELLMNELLKLDAIVAEGDIKEKRKFQVIFSFFFLKFLKLFIFQWYQRALGCPEMEIFSLHFVHFLFVYSTTTGWIWYVYHIYNF
jgi:BAG domain